MSTQRYFQKALSCLSSNARTARTSSPVKTAEEKGCEKTPDAQRQEKRKPVRRGTRVNKYSLSAQPPVPPNGLKTYLQLTEADAPNLPRLDLESPRIFRRELYCRYPGCSVTTRYGQPCALLDHYQIKHDLELKAFKTSIGPVGRRQHEACKTSQNILMYTKHKLILTRLTNLSAFHPATGPAAQEFADKPNDIDDVEWNKLNYVKKTTTKFNDSEKVFFISTHIARRPKDPKYTPKPVEDTATSTPGHRHLTKHTAINRQGSPEAHYQQSGSNLDIKWPSLWSELVLDDHSISQGWLFILHSMYISIYEYIMYHSFRLLLLIVARQ